MMPTHSTRVLKMQHDEILKLLAQSFAELSENLNLLIAKYEGKPEQEAQITEVVEEIKGACEEELRTHVKSIMQGKLKSGAMSRAELKQLITDMGKTALSDLNSDELVKLKTKLGE